MPFNIEVTAADGNTQSIPLPPDGLTIGRQQGNALVLDDQQVSRRHARIEQQGAAIVVTDLDTANGSFLNNQRIAGSSPFRPGDTLRLGQTTIRLQSQEAATMIGTPSPAWTPPASPTPPPASFSNAPAAGPSPAYSAQAPGVAPFPGTFPPPGTVAPSPAQGKSRTPLILGLIAGGGLLLCVCIVGAFFLLGADSFRNTNTTAGSSATETANASSSAGGATGSGAGTLPGVGGTITNVAPGNYTCTLANGQPVTQLFILDSANYADGEGGIGRYSYNSATKTITWESGSLQPLIGYYASAGEAAFGNAAPSPRIYTRDRAGSGTPFDGTTRDTTFARCTP